LLVVIAIIAILIGLLFPAFSAVQNQARKAQAKNDLTQIVNAVNAFYTEYGKYPLPVGTTTDTTYGPGGTTSDVLFNELRACTATQPSCSAAASLNTRQIVFISPRVLGTIPARSGIGSNGWYYDSWGTAYAVEIDGNYDNGVANPYGAQNIGGAGPNPVPLGVIGWSRGKDQTLGTNGNNVYKNPTTGAQSDDVISWQ
jgi:type II secretory pathway pseudopilin PulG